MRTRITSDLAVVLLHHLELVDGLGSPPPAYNKQNWVIEGLPIYVRP